MKRFLVSVTVLVALVCAAVLWLAYTDDSTGATAPNGEPIGAQHPKSEKK